MRGGGRRSAPRTADQRARNAWFIARTDCIETNDSAERLFRLSGRAILNPAFALALPLVAFNDSSLFVQQFARSVTSRSLTLIEKSQTDCHFLLWYFCFTLDFKTKSKIKKI